MRSKIIVGLLAAVGIMGSLTHASSIDQQIAVHLTLLSDTGADYTGETMHTLDHAQALLETNIGTLLTTSSDPERDLHRYMGDIQSSIRQQSLNQQTLREKRDQEIMRRTDCLAQKDTSDRSFYQAMRQGADDETLDSISEKSADAGACAEQSRVKARAYTLMLQQTAGYATKLQQRLTVLRSNETFLIQNRDLIDTDATTILQVNRLVQQLD